MFASRTNWNLTANRLSQSLARIRASGEKLLDLTASNPTECGFRYDGNTILKAFINPAALKYHPHPRGLTAARKAVREYYVGGRISPGDLFLTSSTSEAYTFVLRLLCEPGDELLVPAPSYPLFEFLADIQDVKLVSYPLIYDHGWQIDLHALEQAVSARTRGIVVVNPNNPTGNFVGQEEVAELNRICSARELAIVSDEVFLDFNLSSEKPVTFVSNSGALTFTLSGLSKISGLPQMKLAWLVVSGPESLKREAAARLEVIADTYLSVSTPVQLAAPALLGQRDNFQRQLLSRIKQNLVQLDAQIAEQNQCSRLAVDGGWYAIVRVPAIKSDEDLAIELLEQRNVHVHPGHFYNFSGEGYLVVSLITPEQDFAEGISELLEAVAAAGTETVSAQS
jgi:aspartate/methionine/tyrosine aminotransferase